MDRHSPKLSLDLSPPWLPTPQQPSSSVATGAQEKMKRVDESSSSSVELKKNIARLEAELRKIEAFKRELPLSVLILNEAIEKLKEEATGNRKGLSTSASAAAPDNYCWKLGTKLESYDEENDRTDKKSWMSSAQLWSSSGGGGGEGDGSDRTSFLQLKSANKREPDDTNGDTVLECNYNSTFGVRTSLDKERLSLASTTTRVPDASAAPATSLSLNNSGGLRQVPPLTTAHEPAAATKSVVVRREGRQRISGDQGITDQVRKSAISPSKPIQHQQQQGGSTFKSCGRKQRRCWSPELHRRFVDALEKLGGSQVATPKQIREVMQVDGLTNDEVKSHLQKYRLHVRKLPNTTMSLSRSGEEEDSDGHEQDSNSKSRNSRCKDDDDDADDDSDANQSASPEGPLHLLSVLRRSSKSNSGASRCDCDNSSEEEEMRDAEEERSDGMSIRMGHHYRDSNICSTSY